MRILFLNTYDIKGGAAIGTYRILSALYDANYNVTEYVLFKDSKEDFIKGPEKNFEKLLNLLRPYLEHLPNRIYKNRFANLSISWISNNNLIHKIKKVDPDIVHLNWINDGLLSIQNLINIKKPLVWTLRDMWPFTGGCHYVHNLCDKYVTKCGKCPQLNSKYDFDLSRWTFNRKARVYIKLNLTVVATSNWIANCAKESSLFKGKRIEVIPNLIDINKYKIISKKVCRNILGLPGNKTLILFGAINALKDKRKGFHYLKEALNKLKKNIDFELVIFGAEKYNNACDYGFKTHFLGYLFDDYSLMMVYNAADLFVFPSKKESFGNVAIESLACGIPVVAFNIGGISDIIDHKVNGYLAEPFELDDIANGIEWILNQNKEMLRKNARIKVENNFSSSVVLKKYIDLYKEII